MERRCHAALVGHVVLSRPAGEADLRPLLVGVLIGAQENERPALLLLRVDEFRDGGLRVLSRAVLLAVREK